MSNFFIIIFCLIVGYVFRQVNLAGKNDYKIVNTWVIYIGLPAIALLYLPKIEWGASYLFTAVLPFLVFGFSYLFFRVLNIWFNYSQRTIRTLTIVSGLSNTSFVGFPLIITFFGDDQLKVGIVSDQVTFFTLSTLGVLLAAGSKSIFSSEKQKVVFILKKMFTFPPFLACLFALFVGHHIQSDELSSFLAALAATVSPMALFSIGMQLRFKNLKKELSTISMSLLFKLIFAPSLALGLAFALGVKGVFYQVSVFEMAMPCLVASSMVIEKFGLNVKLSNTIIGLSILLGLVLSFIWYSVINTLL